MRFSISAMDVTPAARESSVDDTAAVGRPVAWARARECPPQASLLLCPTTLILRHPLVSPFRSPPANGLCRTGVKGMLIIRYLWTNSRVQVSPMILWDGNGKKPRRRRPIRDVECRAFAEVMAEAKLLPGPSQLLEPGSVAHQGTNGRSSG